MAKLRSHTHLQTTQDSSPNTFTDLLDRATMKFEKPSNFGETKTIENPSSTKHVGSLVNNIGFSNKKFILVLFAATF